MPIPELVSVIIPTFDRQSDVLNCAASILNSSYREIEIIIVDNNSSDRTVEELTKKYSMDSRLKLIKSKTNLGAGGGRNRGAEEAEGKYLLFVDSDNVVDGRMIDHLTNFFENHPDCGMVGPLMLLESDRETIWTYFADINMFTSQAKYKGTGEKNVGQFPEIVPVGHIPNCFMVKRTDFKKVGGFEEKYIVVYEEADLAEKIKRLGKKVYLFTKAITYHAVELSKTNDRNNYGFRSSERAFLLARNRVYFMRRNATLIQFITFFFIFNPLIFLYYEMNLLRNRDFVKAASYACGMCKGFFL